MSAKVQRKSSLTTSAASTSCLPLPSQHFVESNLTLVLSRAKRYERMMRAHGIAPNAASIKPAPSRSKAERRDSIPLKKRKADQFLEDAGADDDELVGWGNIKEDPHLRDDKALVFKEFKTEGGCRGNEEDHKPQILAQEQGLNLEQATNLMQYYDNSSQLVVDDLYGAGDFGSGMAGYGTPSGYATPLGAGYGLDSQAGYFAAPYGSSGVGNMNSLSGMGVMGGLSSVPHSSPQTFQYQQHSLPFQPEEQGRSDSPLIVE